MSSDQELDPQRALAFSVTLPGSRTETSPDPPAALAFTLSDEPLLPHRLGRYAVLRILGQGGMGVVYSGYDEELNRRVALKVVHRQGHGAESSEQNARVLREAQTLARVSHPNVVQIYEVGKDAPSGNIFIAMEFISGTSLLDFQHKHPARSADALDRCLRLYLQAAAGLLAAHSAGLVHRDFKPDNVIIGEDGRVRVVDFGLARALDGDPVLETTRGRTGASEERLTRVGAVMGTPGYMAPEQVRGEETDARTDQFSFCAALFEALHEDLPFGGETFEEFAANLLAGRLRTPGRGVNGPEVPIIVEQILRRGLSLDKAARFPSMKELISELEAGLLPDADSERSRRHKRRYQVALVAGLLLITTIRLAGLRNSSPMSMRGALFIALASCLALTIILVALRKAIWRQPSVRRQMTLFVTIAAFALAGRTFGYLTDMPHAQYTALELLGMGALFAAHTAVVGSQYLNLTLVCVASIGAQLLLPAERGLTLNLTYAVLAFLAVYLYPSDTGRTKGAA